MPYQKLAGDLRALSGAMQGAIAQVGYSMPPAVGDQFVGAMRLFVDDNGVNHLFRLADELERTGERQVDRSRKLAEGKYEILIEFSLMNLELAMIAALSVFTGGTSFAEAAMVRARTALSIILAMQRLGRAAPMPFTAVLEALEEAFTSFFAQFLSMTVPDSPDRRRTSFDWQDVGRSAYIGFFAGMFGGALGEVYGKYVAKHFKDRHWLKESSEVPFAFVNEGQAAMFGAAMWGLTENKFALNGQEFLMSGVSGGLTTAAEIAMDAPILGLYRQFFHQKISVTEKFFHDKADVLGAPVAARENKSHPLATGSVDGPPLTVSPGPADTQLFLPQEPEPGAPIPHLSDIPQAFSNFRDAASIFSEVSSFTDVEDVSTTLVDTRPQTGSGPVKGGEEVPTSGVDLPFGATGVFTGSGLPTGMDAFGGSYHRHYQIPDQTSIEQVQQPRHETEVMPEGTQLLGQSVPTDPGGVTAPTPSGAVSPSLSTGGTQPSRTGGATSATDPQDGSATATGDPAAEWGTPAPGALPWALDQQDAMRSDPSSSWVRSTAAVSETRTGAIPNLQDPAAEVVHNRFALGSASVPSVVAAVIGHSVGQATSDEIERPLWEVRSRNLPREADAVIEAADSAAAVPAMQSIHAATVGTGPDPSARAMSSVLDAAHSSDPDVVLPNAVNTAPRDSLGTAATITGGDVRAQPDSLPSLPSKAGDIAESVHAVLTGMSAGAVEYAPVPVPQQALPSESVPAGPAAHADGVALPHLSPSFEVGDVVPPKMAIRQESGSDPAGRSDIPASAGGTPRHAVPQPPSHASGPALGARTPELAAPVAEPVRPDQWRPRRPDAPTSPLSVDWFEPGRDPLLQDRVPGTLYGRNIRIRMRIQRIQADDGRWVRNLTLHLPVRFGDGFEPGELPAFQNRMRNLLGTHVNHGLRLPRSGDQLHVDLVLTTAPEHAEAVELSRTANPGRSDQLHIRLHTDGPSADLEKQDRNQQRDDAVSLHELMHYAGLRDQARDDDSLFRRLAGNADGNGLMADTSRLAEGVMTVDYLRTLEDVSDSGPVVRDHPLPGLRPQPNSQRELLPVPADPAVVAPLPASGDDRWEPSQAPRDRSALPSSFVQTYGSQHDGNIGLVHVEPVPASVVDGLHRQVMTALGIPRPAADGHLVLAQLRDRLSAEQLAQHLAYLRSSSGHEITVEVGGRARTVHVRMALRAPLRSERYGAHSVEDPEARVERRGVGTQESSNSAGNGNVRTVAVPWSGTFPIRKAGPVKVVDGALSLTLTHNQLSTSTTVTHGVQTFTAQRARELSQPFAFSSQWEIRLDAAPLGPPVDWSPAQVHGPITIWFPQHLAFDSDRPLPQPADIDDLPLWGVDSVQEPGRLLAEVHREFKNELVGLSQSSAQEVESFLSELSLRGTLPMQRSGGLFSPILLGNSGQAIGIIQLTTEVVLAEPTHRTVDRKINLEHHVHQYEKVDSSVKVTNGIGLDGSVGPSFTADRAAGHAAAASKVSGSLVGKAGVKWQTSDALGAGGSASVIHSLRSNRSHLLVPARVSHRITFIQAGGGRTTHDFGPWDSGMRLRVLSRETALGRPPGPDTDGYELPEELENLQSLGVSAVPLAVEGTAPLFERAEQWLREQGFLPPAQESSRQPFDEGLVQAQLMNLRRFEQARSSLGLRSAVDAMVDGGQPLWLEQPSGTGGTRRVRLRLTAARDTAPDTPARHVRTLPDVQSLGISMFSVGGTQQHGYSYGWQAGFGGGPQYPFGGDKRPWSLGGSGDYTYSRQTTHTSTVGAGVGQDQFFRNSSTLGPTDTGQASEVFEIPSLFALDLYEGPGHGPAVRFTRNDPADGNRTGPATAPGHIALSVGRRRLIEPGRGRRGELPGHRIRECTAADLEKLAMTGPDGAPVPGVVRLPDDAITEVLRGSAALQDAFAQIIANTYPGHPEHKRGLLDNVREAAAVHVPERVSAAAAATADWVSRTLLGPDANHPTTPAAEALWSAISPTALMARAHQIFNSGYVVENLTLPGLGTDQEFSVELQGYLHGPEHRGSAGQYLETDLTSTDTASQQQTKTAAHQAAIASTAQQLNPKSGEVTTQSGPQKPKPPATANPSARYAYTHRTDKTDTLSSATGVMRLPTESGTQHRIRTHATILLTVRQGSRNLIGNAFGAGSAPPVTVAVDLPHGAQFAMSDEQLVRYAAWFRNVEGLNIPDRPEANLPLPDRFARTKELGMAGIMSVKQLNDHASDTGRPTEQHGGRRIEQRDRLRKELTALVEREAPGSTRPGHSSYLPGVMARIADWTSPAGLRTLPGRGPEGVQRFHFRHLAMGGARLVEVSLNARPRQDTAGLRTVRGHDAGEASGSGLEQMHFHSPANTSKSVSTTRLHSGTVNPTTRYVRPADDTRTDRTGPALTLSSVRTNTSKVSTSAEDRYWLRTETAADFEVEYDYTVSVRSQLVADWPPNLVGGLITGGLLAWSDENSSLAAWVHQTLHGRPARTTTVPALVALRFTDSEAADPVKAFDPTPPGISVVHPAEAPATGPGGNRITDGPQLIPTGPTPVFHFDGSPQLMQALNTVAPRLADDWQQLPASASAEATAVRIGELIQAGKINLDLPRATSGLTNTMPGAWPEETSPDTPPTMQIALHNPRRITDAGGITLDRLRLHTTTATTSTVAGSASATVLNLVYNSDGAAGRHTGGASVPLLAQQPITQGPVSATSASRREWFKLGLGVGGSTPVPKTGRGVRSYETAVDTVITVQGAEGVRYVTGSAVARLLERDVLGFGVTDARTDPQVYDLQSMLAEQPDADLRNWATHPLADLPHVLADRFDPQDPAAQLWLAIGADPDGSLLGRTLYTASQTAATANRPVELVLRGDAGLHHWRFDRTGALESADQQTTDAWNRVSTQVTAIAVAHRAQAGARLRENDLRARRAAAQSIRTAADVDRQPADTSRSGAADASSWAQEVEAALEAAADRVAWAADLVQYIDQAVNDQAEHAAAQTAAQAQLSGLAELLRQARQASGEGLVNVPLSSLASTPARWPGHS
ncbi:hypothetical protein [Streptomyces sp. NBC_01320]|uniref:hypothetical protein n=1 Tax=Streptomyces sp. NBC_01320 TaxID=2903824 RepID=UPI002E1630E5|nr:hypothetical protein OG395_56390 [Streptomyces sp. NBC_01320]